MKASRSALQVVHWCPHFQVGGGIANAVIALCRAQRDFGAEPVIVAPGSGAVQLFDIDDTADLDDFFIWKPRRSLRLGNMIFRSISRDDAAALRELDPDVVHVHAEFSADNLRVPRLFNSPIVLSPQGAFHPLVLESSLLRNKILYARIAERVLYRRVAKFHGLTPTEVLHIKSLLPEASTYCVPQGSTLAIGSENAEQHHNDSAGPVTLLFVGRLDVYTKGLDILVDAFELAIRRLPKRELHLRLVGPDSDGGRGVLERRARRLNIGGLVKCPGTVSRREVRDLLATDTMYVQLSRHEGLSLSACEALVAGMPVVLSVEACPFPELAALEHVSVVEPVVEQAAAAIVAAVNDLERRRASVKRSLPFVREFFSWPRIARIHLARYAELMDAGDRASQGPYPLSPALGR